MRYLSGSKLVVRPSRRDNQSPSRRHRNKRKKKKITQPRLVVHRARRKRVFTHCVPQRRLNDKRNLHARNLYGHKGTRPALPRIRIPYRSIFAPRPTFVKLAVGNSEQRGATREKESKSDTKGRSWPKRVISCSRYRIDRIWSWILSPLNLWFHVEISFLFQSYLI